VAAAARLRRLRQAAETARTRYSGNYSSQRRSGAFNNGEREFEPEQVAPRDEFEPWLTVKESGAGTIRADQNGSAQRNGPLLKGH
jgi:hypothetical protein